MNTAQLHPYIKQMDSIPHLQGVRHTLIQTIRAIDPLGEATVAASRLVDLIDEARTTATGELRRDLFDVLALARMVHDGLMESTKSVPAAQWDKLTQTTVELYPKIDAIAEDLDWMWKYADKHLSSSMAEILGKALDGVFETKDKLREFRDTDWWTQLNRADWIDETKDEDEG